MSEFFQGAPKITVRAAAEKGPEVAIRWEAEDGSDADRIDALIGVDASDFLLTQPEAAIALVHSIRTSAVYQRMATHVAELDGRLVGFAMLAQVRVGVRTHLLYVGSAVAADAPANTREKLLDSVVQAARAGFYSAILTTASQTPLPKLALKPAAECGIVTAPALTPGTLLAGELIPYGLDALGGQMVFDEAYLGLA